MGLVGDTIRPANTQSNINLQYINNVPALHVRCCCKYCHCHVGQGTAAPRTQVVLTQAHLQLCINIVLVLR
jgi:hypothetical protein